MIFPPVTKTESVQEQLRPDELLLIYVKSGTELHAFMLSADKYVSWKVDSPEQIQPTLVKLYKAIGNQDRNASINADQFQRTDWRPLARQLRDQLIQRQQFGFWNRYERLVVVPDDIVWHVPFELLLIPDPAAGDGAHGGRRSRRRYSVDRQDQNTLRADDFSFDRRPAAQTRVRHTPILVGELYPRNGEQTREQFAEWQTSFTNLQPLPINYPPRPASFGPSGTDWSC